MLELIIGAMWQMTIVDFEEYKRGQVTGYPLRFSAQHNAEYTVGAQKNIYSTSGSMIELVSES